MTSEAYQFSREMDQLHYTKGSDVRTDEICGSELLGLWEEFC
jgi:hypothetical protein